MAWFAARCPVAPREERWITESMDWMTEEFGPAVHRPVILPTPDFFPGSYEGGEADVRAVVRRVAGYLDVDHDRLDVEFVDDVGDAELLAHLPAYARSSKEAAGHYRRRGDRCVISVNASIAVAPVALVATVAHELGHVLLLGDGRIPPDRADGEPLTDLLTVHLGMGIFGANAAHEFASTSGGWQTNRLGYLTEPMFGYALARWAWLRGEPDPRWQAHLDTNPRAYLRKGLRFLHRDG